MDNLFKSIAIGFLVIISSYSALAQNDAAKANKWSVRVEEYRPVPLIKFENATLNGFHFPKNVGFCVGAERNRYKTDRGRRYQTAVLGFYNHVYFERVATLQTGYGINYRLYKGVTLGFEGNVGYNFARSSHLVSTFEIDRWVSKVDKSVINHRFAAGVAANVQYDFGQHFDGKFPVAVILGYSGQALIPFDKDIYINFFAYHQPQVGVRWGF